MFAIDIFVKRYASVMSGRTVAFEWRLECIP